MSKIITASFFTFIYILFTIINPTGIILASNNDAASEARNAIRAGRTRYVPDDAVCTSKSTGNTTASEAEFIKEFGDTSGIAWLELGQTPTANGSPLEQVPVAFGEVKSISAWSTIKVLIIAAYLKQKGSAGDQEQNIILALKDSNNDAIMAIKSAGGTDDQMSQIMEEILSSAGDKDTDVVIEAGTQGGVTTKWSFANQTKFMSALRQGKVVSKETSDYILAKMAPAQTWGLGQIGSTTYKPGWGEVGQETRQMGLVKSKNNKEYAVAFGNINNTASPDEELNNKLAKWFESNILLKESATPSTINPGSSPAAAEQSGEIATDPTQKPQARIYSFLIAKGLTPIQAVGFIVNIEEESGLNKDSKPEDADRAASNTSEVGGQFGNADPYAPGGLGLIQWTGSRRVKIVQYAESINKDVFNFDFQLNYLWKELTENYKKVYEDLKKATNVTESQKIILEDFESPAQVNQDKRNISQPPRAEELLKELAGIDAASGGSGCLEASTSTPGKYGWDLKEGSNKMVYYAQGDPLWGKENYDPSGGPENTIGSSGCGITAIAMVVSTLGTRKVTPSETAKWSLTNGFADGGTTHAAMPAAAKNYQLEFEELGATNFEKAKQILMEGGLITTSFNGGFFGNHYMVIRKVSEDGKTFYFADPEQSWGDGEKQTNTKGFTIEEIVSKGPPMNMWAFKKKTTVSI